MKIFKTLILTIFFTINFENMALALASDNNLPRVQKFVENVGNGVVNIAKENISEAKKKSKIIDLIDKSIDANWIARFVLSKNYRKATAKQREQFKSLYRQFMINTYGPKFKNYNGKKFEVIKVEKRGRYYLAKAEFLPANSQTHISVDFRVKDKKGKLVILDFVAEGVSLIETQRSEFNSAISQKGMDGFLADLEKRVIELKK